MGFSGSSKGNGDVMEYIFNAIREWSKKTTFVNKNDIFVAMKGQCDRSTFDSSINRLIDDGRIYTGYSEDVVTINTD
jgi:hypothetical protein